MFLEKVVDSISIKYMFSILSSFYMEVLVPLKILLTFLINALWDSNVPHIDSRLFYAVSVCKLVFKGEVQ